MGYSIIISTGGARSGKSRFAESLCLDINRRYWNGKKISYIATGEVMDEEFRHRIELHKERRGEEFLTVEEPLNILEQIKRSSDSSNVIIVECLSTWLGNLFHYKKERVEMELNLFLSGLDKLGISGSHKDGLPSFFEIQEPPALLDYSERLNDRVLVFVTNEVGSGLVPATRESRLYRDLLGKLNSELGGRSEHLFSCVAGIPSKIR